MTPQLSTVSVRPLDGRARGRLAACTVLVLAFATTAILNAAFSGAIYTTLGNGETVNQNVYDSKEDVFLNGGPQNENSAGLPDGLYYFQVTSPNGVLLSTDPAVCRQVEVSGGVIFGVPDLGAGDPGCLHAEGGVPPGTPNPVNGTIPIQLIPFLDTPNSGGEYKVWLIPQAAADIDPLDDTVLLFSNADAKTDNFKVLEQEGTDPCLDNPELPECQELPGENTLSGRKCYDANLNGLCDENESGIPGWQIYLGGDGDSNTTTDADGDYAFLNLPDGSYAVCEVIPENAPVWINTSPALIDGIVLPPDSEDNDFANVCLGAGGGRTLGFWSNKNGAKLFDETVIDALPLVDASGAGVNLNGHPAFKSWILGAHATNMAYMLSAQLAAMALNVDAGFVEADAIVYAPGCGNLLDDQFISITHLMNDAVAQLMANPLTLDGHLERDEQECIKNALDAANNNENFVQAEACEVNYSGLEGSCFPAE